MAKKAAAVTSWAARKVIFWHINRSAIPPNMGFAIIPHMGKMVYMKPTITEEKPNWRAYVDKKGTTGPVPAKKNIDSYYTKLHF